jgi:hypothetical protein
LGRSLSRFGRFGVSFTLIREKIRRWFSVLRIFFLGAIRRRRTNLVGERAEGADGMGWAKFLT